MMNGTEEYLDLITSALSQETGIKIKASDKWAVNLGSQKVLYYDKVQMRNLPFDATRGLLLHEIAHLKYTDQLSNTKALKRYKNKIAEVYKACEDIRIERKLRNDYGSFAQEATSVSDYYACEGNILAHDYDYTKVPRLHAFLNLLLFRYYGTHTQVNRLVGDDADDIFDEEFCIFDPTVLQRHTDNRQEIREIIDDLYNADTTANLQKVVDKRLLPLIRDFLKDKKKKDKEKEKEKDGQGSGNGSHESSASLVSAQAQQQNQQGQEIPQGGRGVGAKTKKPRPITKLTEREAKALLRPYSNVLAARLREIMKEKKAVKFRGAYLGGKLLSKNAYKVAIDEPRCFSKRSLPDTPNYSIYLGLDSSGSMEGDKATYAFMGAVLLKDVAQKLGFKIKIFHYDSEAYEICDLDRYRATGGDTRDEALLESVERRVSGLEENILFVITDGMTRRTDEFDVLKKKLQKKNTLVYGIDIGSESDEAIKKNYDPGIYVSKVEELPKVLIESLRRVIHR